MIKDLLTNSSVPGLRFHSNFPIQPKYDYGCYCRYITEKSLFQPNSSPGTEVVGGSGVDKIDKLCKKLMNGWACLAEEGCDIENLRYTSPGFFGFLDAESYMEECEVLNVIPFRRNLCKVEFWFVVNFVEAFFSNPTSLRVHLDEHLFPPSCK